MKNNFRHIPVLLLTIVFLHASHSSLSQNANLAKVDSVKSIVFFNYTSPICAADQLLKPKPAENFRTGGSYASGPGLQVDSLSGTIDLLTSTPGTYTITYLVPANADTSLGIQQAYITIRPAPILTLNPNMIIEPGSEVTLHVKGGQSYTWSPAGSLSCENCANPTATPLQNTEYCVTSSIGSCYSSACTKIEIACNVGKELVVPNAFSPDGDGNNDAFCLQGWGHCVKEFSFVVFNRWGEKVFESQDPTFCWDGSYKGATLEASVFVYMISATYSETNKLNKKGNITLIR